MAHCNGCGSDEAWWVRSSTNHLTKESYECCSQCSNGKAPSVTRPEWKGKQPVRQHSSAAFNRTPQERDKIVNHMLKAGGSQVDQFAVMSRDTKGSLVREEFNSKGNIVSKKVIGPPKK